MAKSDNKTASGASGNKLIVIAILTLCLIVFIIVFFLVLGKITGKTRIASNKNKSTDKSAVLKLGISTDWNKFYSSHNYNILYPAFFTLFTEQNKDGIGQKHYLWQNNDEAVIQFLEPDSQQINIPLGMTVVLKFPEDNPENYSLPQWMKKRFPALGLVKSRKIKLSNFEAYFVQPFGSTSTYIYIPYKQKIFQITRIIETSSKLNQKAKTNLYNYEAIFQDMLDTLEFTD